MRATRIEDQDQVKLADEVSPRGLANITDSALIERLRQGERKVYAELVQRYQAKLVRTIYRMVGDAQVAEDLAQDAFLKAYDRLSQFDASKRFGPWLFQIGVNGAVDWLRRNRKHKRVSLNELRSTGEPMEVPDPDPRPHVDTQQEVRHVLEQLPTEYQQVLALRELEGLPCSEIAAIIGRQEPTVRWRLIKAREMFKRLWLRRGNDS